MKYIAVLPASPSPEVVRRALLVLGSDPTLDARNTRRPLMVFKGGTLRFRRNAP